MATSDQETVHRIIFFYRVFYMMLGFFFLVMLFNFLTQPAWEAVLFFALLVVMTFVNGRFHVLRLRITNKHLDVQYLTQKVQLTRDDIESIKDAYVWNYMYPTPSVEITVRNRKRPIRLFDLDIEANVLKRQLDDLYAG